MIRLIEFYALSSPSSDERSDHPYTFNERNIHTFHPYIQQLSSAEAGT